MVEIVTPSIPPFALAATSYVYVAVGLALGFAGRAIWGRLMTLLGIILGAAVGYSLGVLILPGLASLGLAIVGAAIGGMIFTWIVEVALAGMAGALGLYVTYRGLLEYISPSDALVVGILVLLIIFSLSFYYMQSLMSYVSALLGGILAGVGFFLLTNDLQLSIISSLGIVILGSLVQEFLVKRYEERIQKTSRKPAVVVKRR
ncbi:MAG: hypothetical protein LN412_04145 [Candidatus Thermoplasmatota archaeon]|nr:hypothetical protein [Candidatus Thermoplasmatota archaeon]